MWRQRRERQEASWTPLIEDLADAFMLCQYKRPPPPAPSTPSIPSSPSSDAPPSDEYFITFITYDIFSLIREQTVVLSPSNASPTIDLMARGWVAKTPERPTVAVSITTLELLHRLRRRKASFSVEAFVKVVCEYYKVCQIPVPYHVYSIIDHTDSLSFASTSRVFRYVRAVHPSPTG